MAGSSVDATAIEAMFRPGGEVSQWHFGVVRAVRGQIVRRAPVDTGRLRSSIRTKTTRPGKLQIVSTIYTDVDYARYVVFGGPRWIYPRRRQFLRFRGRGGQWVFARRVRGQRPNNFFQDGLLAGAGATHRIRLRVPKRLPW